MSSVTTSATDASSTSSGDLSCYSADPPSTGINLKCPLCTQTFILPKVLDCFHTFCQSCLDKKPLEGDGGIGCPTCKHVTCLGPGGSADLVPDYAVKRAIEAASAGEHSAFGAVGAQSRSCTGCKSDMGAVARCFSCDNLLCPNCVTAHQYMHCFEGHLVQAFEDAHLVPGAGAAAAAAGPQQSASSPSAAAAALVERPLCCAEHRLEPVRFFCKTCGALMCKECGAGGVHHGHEYEYLSEALLGQHTDLLRQLVGKAKVKANNLRSAKKTIEHTSNRLQSHYNDAVKNINETFNFYKAQLDERKKEILKELDSATEGRRNAVTSTMKKTQEAIDQLYSSCEFIDKLIRHASPVEALHFKRMLELKVNELLVFQADLSPFTTPSSELMVEFISNFQAIKTGVANTFGYIRQHGAGGSNHGGAAPQGHGGSGGGVGGSGPAQGSAGGLSMSAPQPVCKPKPIARPNGYSANGAMRGGQPPSMLHPGCGPFDGPGPATGKYGMSAGGDNSLGGLNGLAAFSAMHHPEANALLPGNAMSPYDAWSAGGLECSIMGLPGGHPRAGDMFPMMSQPIPLADMMEHDPQHIMDGLDGKYLFPAPKPSQIKRQKMGYHCKFGEFGVLEGQFTEPSGVAVNAQNDIIVADTNNHRIQIFDREGRFKFQFGECGKHDGQLLYPNRVAVVRSTGDIVVTERSPTHQVQIFNQYGQFVRKFGANVLQHPRGVTVDNKGRIIVVECKVMRVVIMDLLGNVLHKFGCTKHLEFPNGVAVNNREEIFISDNRGHCVRVFSYQGQYLRQIGGEGLSNYPIGVCINSIGEVLIADNHNNFNLTVFTQDGQFVAALESKVKHAQCFDVAVLDRGSIVMASKDYRLYVYQYADPQSFVGGGVGMGGGMHLDVPPQAMLKMGSYA